MNKNTAHCDSPAISWLKNHAPGFSALTESEYQTIMEFSLLWSLFEGEVMNTSANAGTIRNTVNAWAEKGFLGFEKFAASFKYFTARYFNDGQFTGAFNGLNFRRNDNIELVQQALSFDQSSDSDKVTTLLIIVYRLRNNLFHGIKWADSLKGQLENFEHANATIMAAIETHRVMP